jgi:hypothetical protein
VQQRDAGLPLQSPIEATQRFGMPAKIQKYVAAIAQQFRLPGLKLQGGLVALQCFAIPPQATQNHTATEQQFRPRGGGTSGTIEIFEGLGMGAAGQTQLSQQFQRPGVPGVSRQGRGGEIMGLGGKTTLPPDQGKPEMGFRIPGTGRNPQAQNSFRLFRQTLLLEGEGAPQFRAGFCI